MALDIMENKWCDGSFKRFECPVPSLFFPIFPLCSTQAYKIRTPHNGTLVLVDDDEGEEEKTEINTYIKKTIA